MSFDILVEFGSQCQIIWTLWTGSQFIAWRRWQTNRLIERKCKSQMPESQDDFTNWVQSWPGKQSHLEVHALLIISQICYNHQCLCGLKGLNSRIMNPYFRTSCTFATCSSSPFTPACWSVFVSCVSVCLSPRSSCGCSSGSRMSCGGWRRSWPPRTCEYANWSSSSTTWRTLAPTTSDLWPLTSQPPGLAKLLPLPPNSDLQRASEPSRPSLLYIITSFLLPCVVHTITW